MSRENVEVVRRIYDLFVRGDCAAARELLDPDLEWREPPQSPGAAVYQGPEGAEQSYRGWKGAWADYELQLDELVDAGDHVLARTLQRVRAQTSGMQLEQPLHSAWTLRGGKAIRMRMFHDECEAREAAGLRDQPTDDKKHRP